MFFCLDSCQKNQNIYAIKKTQLEYYKKIYNLYTLYKLVLILSWDGKYFFFFATSLKQV